MDNIPKPIIETITQEIPQNAAELSSESEAPEAKPYVISFENYNKKLCELKCLGKNKAKKALEIIKEIGTKVCCSTDFQRYSIDRIPVDNSGDYRRLFNKIPEDAELKEIKLQEDARIFYYDLEPERKFFIVAITENHFETDKVRR